MDKLSYRAPALDKGLDIIELLAVSSVGLTQAQIANQLKKSVILISTDTDELLKLSDKICVIYKGKLSKIMKTEDVTAEKLGLLMGGGEIG